MLSFLLIKSFFKVILLFILGSISITLQKKILVGITLKEISSFLLWTVKFEDRENGL